MTLKAKHNIIYTLRDLKIKVVQEYVFHPERKFRFDFAIPDKKIAIEYEGIYAGGKMSRHTSWQGYTNDCEKYNLAVINGWRILRYTGTNYTSLRTDILQLLQQ